MKKILIATRNPGKFFEIHEVLKELPMEFVSLRDLDVQGDVKEDGKTFEENAFKKARFFYDKTDLSVIAEDSGLLVDALPGELGVHTRRWGKGESASDEEWIEYFMEKMSQVDVANKGARFVCTSVFYDGDEPEYFVGETEGLITAKLEAPIKEGLPLSSCFRPKGFEKVYSALTPEEKMLVSHRGKALTHLRDFLEERF